MIPVEITIPQEELYLLGVYDKTRVFNLNSEQNTNIGSCRIIKSLNNLYILELTVNDTKWLIYQNYGLINNFDKNTTDFTIQSDLLLINFSNEDFIKIGF